MVRTWVRIPARGPTKFNTNYSPEETHEAAAVHKSPETTKPTSSSYISSRCSSTCTAKIASRAAAKTTVADMTAASSAYAANISRDGEAWQQTQISVAWSADSANKAGTEKLRSKCRQGGING